jgi:hypothetical protein
MRSKTRLVMSFALMACAVPAAGQGTSRPFKVFAGAGLMGQATGSVAVGYHW